MSLSITNTFLPALESQGRIKNLQNRIAGFGFDGIIIFDGIEQLYYAGTIQNGLLYIPAKGQSHYFVRRSYERAKLESPHASIFPYLSFRDVSSRLIELGFQNKIIGIDEGSLSITFLKMLVKAFSEVNFVDAGMLLKKNRSVKSPYEIAKMRKAGEVSRTIIKEIPGMLHEGMTEWQLALALHTRVADLGRNCLSRLATGSGEFFLGNVCFGDSSTMPTAFDGPGGLPGLSPACPYGGSERKLKKGDLVYIDIGYPYEEYYVDKTRLFSFKGELAEKVKISHQRCLEIQEAIRKNLKPGLIPSNIYETVMNDYAKEEHDKNGLMGHESNQVKFFGHGIGMVINEYPVIAKKFDEPLVAGMTIAVEPKQSLPGIGMVGIENTFIVTENGGENITSDNDEIVVVN